MEIMKPEVIQVNLKEKLGEVRYEDISEYFERELGTSLEELEKGVKVLEPQGWFKWGMLSNSIIGCYKHETKEMFIVNPEDIEVIVHEFTHVHQYRRKGAISGLKRRLSKLACHRMMHKQGTFLYQIDFWEREARRIASKYINK